MFRKIKAEDNKYVETKRKYYKLINEFKSYLEEETLKSGQTKTGTSGKASSYARYLVRLIIIFQEYFPNEYVTFRSKEGSSKLNQLRQLNGYKDYNKNEGRYPNATLNKFEEFIKNLSLMAEREADELLNYKLNNKNNILESNDFIKENKASYGPLLKKDKKSIKDYAVYNRSLYEAQLAKQKSDWLCEIDNNHTTFLNSVDGKPFMEAHHLIPMAYQDEFEYSIDFADNIVSLCPNCHRKIHYATSNEKLELLELLYNNRKLLFPKYGINISFSDVMNYYNIK